MADFIRPDMQNMGRGPVYTLKSGFAQEGKLLSFAPLPNGTIHYFVRLEDGTTDWFSEENVFRKE